MSFCPICSKILRSINEKDKFILICESCGLHQEIINPERLVSKEKLESETKGEGFVNDENIYATYENICKKCGHNKSQIIDMGVFISDEDSLILIKCGKCGHTERIGRRTS